MNPKLILAKIEAGELRDSKQIANFIRSGDISLKSVKDLNCVDQTRMKEIAFEHIKSENPQISINGIAKEYCNDNIITASDLKELAKNWLETDQVKLSDIEQSQVFNAFEILNFARRLSQPELHNVIKNYYNHGKINESDVVPDILTKREFNRLLDINPGPDIDYDIFIPDFSKLPPPEENRTNIFTLGVPGSGKSVFLAGLFFHLQNIGRVKLNLEHRRYIDGLTEALDNSKLPPATPEQNPIFIEATIKSKNDKNVEIPLTFFDMSGELFRKAYASRLENMPLNLSKYIKHNNNKVFVLVIDYDVKSGQRKQANQLESIIDALANDGILNYTIAINILVTKWDLSGYGDASLEEQEQHLIEFLTERYPNLIGNCKDYANKFKFKLSIFSYSLGAIDKYDKRVTFNPIYSDRIYEWFSTMPRKPKSDTGGFFGKLFS